MRVLLQHGANAQASAFRPSDKGRSYIDSAGTMERDPFTDLSPRSTILYSGLLRTTLVNLGQVASENSETTITYSGLLRSALVNLGQVASESPSSTISYSGSMAYALNNLGQVASESPSSTISYSGTLTN